MRQNFARAFAHSACDQIDDPLLRLCYSRQLAGAVAIAAAGSDTVYERAVGLRSLGSDTPMTHDTVFWIASMTKAITGAAAMQLVEQGKLTLDDPIARLLPDLAGIQVLDGFAEDGAPRLRPAQRAITLRHLLTHTAGFCYDMWNGDIARYRAHAGLPGLGASIYAALLTPLVTEPGTRWEYSTGIDWAGFAVEAASGKPLDLYLHDHLFAPLGMIDTGFIIRDDQRPRLAAVHRREENGSLTPTPFETNQAPERFMGGGGLYSTARDYLAFMQMILNKGRVGNAQLLNPETVALMGENHIGDLAVTPMASFAPHLTNPVDFFPGMAKRWGLSFMINNEPTPEGRSAGSLAWAGLGNTYYWIDPARNVCGTILMQVLPFADRICLDAFATFERGVYASLSATKAAQDGLAQ